MRKTTWLLVPLLVFSFGAKKKKKKKKKGETEGPTVGWYQAESWVGSCYYPPDFSDMGGGERRMKLQESLTEVMNQWKGTRDDGVAFDPIPIENVETVLLGHPDKISGLLTDNYAQCARAMSGKGTDDWSAWLVKTPGRLMKGECRRPLDSTLYNYIDIGTDWQFTAPVCDENVIKITASATDEYRVDDDGPWITAAGDPDKAASGSDYPCNTEGCQVGQLVLRFRGDSGVQIVKPVGLELVFDPPEHGDISVMVNDTSYFNNQFRVVKGIQHHTSVTYEPLE